MLSLRMKKPSLRASASLLIVATGAALSARGLTIRHDRSYSQYTDFCTSTLPQTGSVTGAGWAGSGTLISPTWVLTAGHVADPTATSFSGPSGTRSIVARYAYSGGDVGLVKLNSPINSVTPAKLYNVQAFGTEIARDVLIAGAGLQGTGLTGQQSPLGTPRAAQSLVEAFDGLTKVYTRFREPGAGAADLEGSGVQGDSGGGLFMNVNNQWAIAGVQTQSYYYGDLSNLGKYGSGGVYMRTGLSDVLGWILSYATDAALVGGYVTNGPIWNIDSSGDWNDTWNWNKQVIPNGVGKEANLLSAITSRRTVYSDKPITLGTLRFDSRNTYQLAGLGGLSIDVATGNGSITVLSGVHEINLPLSIRDSTTVNVAAGAGLRIKDPMTLTAGAVFTKTGSGTLSIQAPVYAGAASTLAIAEGMMSADTDLGTANSLLVSGGIAEFRTAQHLSSLSIENGEVLSTSAAPVSLRVSSMTIGEEGVLLLQGGAVIVDYDKESPVADISDAIASGRIICNQLDSHTAIAFGESADLITGSTGQIFGEQVDPTAIIITRALRGDASLDGRVNSIDFGIIVSHFGAHTASGWTQGDVTSDGMANTLDFNELTGQFGETIPPLSSVVVPEPSSLLVMGFAALCGQQRRSFTRKFRRQRFISSWRTIS